MIVTRTDDPAVVLEALADDYDRMSQDGDPSIGDITPDMEAATYFAGHHNGELVGVVMFKEKDDSLWCHISTIKKMRGHARELASGALSRMSGPFLTAIPLSHRSTLRFAESLGFELVGVDRDGWTKNGVKYNLYKLRLE